MQFYFAIFSVMKDDVELMTGELDEEVDQEVHIDHLELVLQGHGLQGEGQSHLDTGHLGQDHLDWGRDHQEVEVQGGL